MLKANYECGYPVPPEVSRFSSGEQLFRPKYCVFLPKRHPTPVEVLCVLVRRQLFRSKRRALQSGGQLAPMGDLPKKLFGGHGEDLKIKVQLKMRGEYLDLINKYI